MAGQRVSQIIAVIGGEQADPAALRDAETLGRLLAERGCTVACGGRGGVMAAVCRGARKAGGHTIGLLPGMDRSEANRWVEFALPTGLGFARNTLVVLAGDAVIAVDGSYGTLSEIGFALVARRPVVGLGTWSFRYRGREDESVVPASSPEEAVKLALQLARERAAGKEAANDAR